MRFAVGLLCLGLAACGEPQPPRPAPVPESVLATAPVELRDVELTYTAEAVVEAVRQSTVAAQIAGRIVELRFDVGDYVKKGEVIARIDERAATQALAASEAQVRQAEAALRNARAEFERSKQLVAQKFLSQAALDRAEAEYKAAQARVTALLAGAGQAQTERSFATIVAPYSGLVSARHVELGEMAVPGKPLMTGFDPGTLRVTATVPQAQIAAIQAGAKARVEVPSTSKWVAATQLTVIPAADPRTHTTQVRLGLPADVRGIYPGIYARAHFVTGRAQALLVPRAAVLQRSEVTAVYVVAGPGRPQLRQIRLGSAGDEHSVEVLAGLKPGERVALEPVKAGIKGG
ncbi:MAG TPA: efflux RND transporter periplasmic adaptor subunit [Ramlibacter sp.]|uniref:efflux RND transporter periplasmic adaptor subunit n=1 Tax=Ramlibacter sp. TaxID=1917967 RepID=UPI002D7FBBB0|nr:efflux RND transporter periplasmic adaptor subunit [Ramlibacter sp.]HET8747266.1 efflux RND transporter periplasmic adaptor subunit [Ramlibacter sp.]